MTTIPKPGMIGLTPIAGDVGRLIRFGQWLNGDGFNDWEHAFVLLPDDLILEAQPGGAVIVPQHHEYVYWCTGIYKLLPPATTAAEIDHVAESLKGTPYSFLDYLALAQHRLHIPGPGLRRFIQTSGHEICSQLADDFYYRLGVHIYVDNRWPGDVAPADLYKRDREFIDPMVL